MPKLRHLAIIAMNPEELAKFYCDVFEMEIVKPIPPASTLADLLWERADYWSGRPCIAGTGITVGRVGIHYRSGNSAEAIWCDILDKAVPLANVHAAIAFYLANQAAIDSDLDEQDREFDRIEADYQTAAPR